MATGDFLTWSVQAQDAPAHAGRFLQTILLNEGVVDVAGGSFETTEDTGANMNITIGSGTLGDLAVVEGDDTAGQGVYVIEAQNATVTKTIAASDPSDDRIDLVVLQNYDDEADSSGNNDAEVEVIEGTPAGSPSAPALPDSAIPLAEVLVGAGVTAITNANITDTRSEARVKAATRLSQGRWTRSSLQTISDSATTTVAYNSLVREDDPDNDFTMDTGTGVVTINRAGWYRVYAGVMWTATFSATNIVAGTHDVVLYITLNGTPIAGNYGYFASNAVRFTASTLQYFDAGDTTNAAVRQETGVNRTLNNHGSTFFAIERAS